MTNGKSKVLEISRAAHQLSYKQQFHKIIKIATIMGEVVRNRRYWDRVLWDSLLTAPHSLGGSKGIQEEI